MRTAAWEDQRSLLIYFAIVTCLEQNQNQYKNKLDWKKDHLAFSRNLLNVRCKLSKQRSQPSWPWYNYSGHSLLCQLHRTSRTYALSVAFVISNWPIQTFCPFQKCGSTLWLSRDMQQSVGIRLWCQSVSQWAAGIWSWWARLPLLSQSPCRCWQREKRRMHRVTLESASDWL